MNEAIVVNHVSKSYGKKVTTPLPHREGQRGGSVGVPALSDVSFSVSKGEVFGIIGPDGAGKTTMFRIMATLLLPDQGTATVDGYDVVSQMKDIRRRVGYMPGKFSLYQDLTVRENLEFFATLFGTTVDEGYDSIRAIYSQIERFENRRAGALSGGMKQKLALSCALVHQPSVLFLDEPTTGVDPVSRKEFWEMLATLKERGITIVAATPYLDEVRCCERVAFLSEGQLMGIDTPEVILDRFREVFNPPPLKAQQTHPQPLPTMEGSGYSQGQKLSTPLPTMEGQGGGSGGSAISVSHLVKAFGSFHAVDDISFTVKKGEIFGFLGANGAGKTTAMHILTGLNLPTSGTGTVAGFDIRTEYDQIKKHIGYMSQKFSLYEDLTVSENIRLFGGIYGMSAADIKTKTAQLLKKLDFEAHANDLVGSLPLGWKQKLAFSVSIFHDPGIVFLDEPTGGVDPATRRQFWELIYDAAARGITVFVTTHYMDEAEYCDRISIMVDGKISAIGTPEELKQQYGKADMDGVFTYLARQAKRKE
ncbi:MAG: ABC transporter ATP-binding protein [Prevotella sp.]|nr:ABC transporter ATP-binding protein [Prevotella sp.]